MTPDFAQCAQDFLGHAADRYPQWIFNGSLQSRAEKANFTYITLEGCRELCGTGTQYYTWKDTANTISTWILPILGLMVQAPWESNQARQTCLMFFRWIGSPIAALSYIFWNIKVTGKCALMVDMSTKYDEYPPEDSEFSHMRDSMYILCIMNQYSLKPALPPVESEKLLRLVLFSSLIRIDGSKDPRDSIVHRRTELAKEMREGRKKGVIPVFISFLWFVFALALSIELAFDDIGGNATAHNLAMGLLVGWLPVMVVSSTVDRNQSSADAIREKLNALVMDVRRTLLEDESFEEYCKDSNTNAQAFLWTENLRNEEVFDGNFFDIFSGQGRTHFHYGAAHPILCSLETKFISKFGRDWLHYGAAARVAMISGATADGGLKMFDGRMAWQVVSSIVMVLGCGFGSFIISWFTPTVGLSCRTGGHLIYMIISLALLIIEFSVWGFTHENTHTHNDFVRRFSSKLERSFTGNFAKTLSHDSKKHKIVKYLHSTAFRDIARNFVLIPLETVNTGWLLYILWAQTVGAYQTCYCQASSWARGQGGYIDFSTYAVNSATDTYVYWSVGTALSCIILFGGLLYVVNEYCTQSHLSTEDYARAMQGLRITRRIKKHTRFVYYVPDKIIRAIKWSCWVLRGFKPVEWVVGERKGGGLMSKGGKRRGVVWTVEHKRRMGLEALSMRDAP